MKQEFELTFIAAPSVAVDPAETIRRLLGELGGCRVSSVEGKSYVVAKLEVETTFGVGEGDVRGAILDLFFARTRKITLHRVRELAA